MGSMKGDRSKKKTKKGVGIDFKRVKTKVGRKLPKPENATRTDFKSKGIAMPEQRIAAENAGAVSHRHLSLKDLLNQCTHHNETTRKNALVGLKDLLDNHPRVLPEHAAEIVEKIAARISDTHAGVRDALLILMRSTIIPALPKEMMAPFMPIFKVHICGAMTHRMNGVQLKSLSFLNLLLDNYPALLQSSLTVEIPCHYVELLCGGKQAGRSLSWHLEVLTSLMCFLRVTSGVENGSTREEVNHKPTNVNKWPQRTQDTCCMGLHSYRSRPWLDGSLNNKVFSKGAPGGIVDRTQPTSETQDAKVTSLSGRGKTSRQSLAVIKQLPRERNAEHYRILVMALVPILLDCWSDCRPSAANLTQLQCMTKILELLDFLFVALEVAAGAAVDVYALRSGTGARSWRVSSKAVDGAFFNEAGETDDSMSREVCSFLRDSFLPRFLQCIMTHFPVTSAPGQSSPKVAEEITAVNLGIYRLFHHFLLSRELRHLNKSSNCDVAMGGMEKEEEEEEWVESLVDYYEEALDGKDGSGDARRWNYQEASALLSGMLLRALPCLTSEYRERVLKVFTKVYEKSGSKFAMKGVCLEIMLRLLQRLEFVPEAMQGRWLDSLPRLLWELKDERIQTSTMILNLLHWIGRSYSPGSLLGNKFLSLQTMMVPFFCVSTGGASLKKVFGPFLLLPEECQIMAVDTVSFFPSISRPLLRALAQCCLSSKLSLRMALRIVEVIQHGPAEIEPSERLSFLLTIIMGQSDNTGYGGRMAKEGEDQPAPMTEIAKEKTEPVKRGEALIGAACAALGNMGDGNLLLSLISPTLTKFLKEVDLTVVAGPTMYAVMRAVAVCCHQCFLTGDLSDMELSHELAESLPQTIARIGMSVVERGDSLDSRKQHQIFLPCIPVLLTFPRLLLPPLFDCLVHVAKTGWERKGDGEGGAVAKAFAAVDLISSLFQLEYLEKVLIKLEREIFSSVEDFCVAASTALDSSCQGLDVVQVQRFRSKVQRLASQVHCFYGVPERNALDHAKHNASSFMDTQ